MEKLGDKTALEHGGINIFVGLVTLSRCLGWPRDSKLFSPQVQVCVDDQAHDRY